MANAGQSHAAAGSATISHMAKNWRNQLTRTTAENHITKHAANDHNRETINEQQYARERSKGQTTFFGEGGGIIYNSSKYHQWIYFMTWEHAS